MSYTKKKYDNLQKCDNCGEMFDEGWNQSFGERNVFLCDDCYHESMGLIGRNYQETKLRIWQGRLINISSKNPLVNFQNYESSTVEFLSPSPVKIFKTLQDNKTLTFGKWTNLKINSKLICPHCNNVILVNYSKYSTLPVKTKCEQCHHEINYNKLIPINDQSQTLEFKDNVLISTRNDLVTEKALNLIIARNKSSNLNLGLHMLYVACGFLYWKGSEITDEFRLSPILLIKIEINVDKSHSTYKVNLVNNEIVVNPTLKYLFANYHKMVSVDIPEYDDTTDNYGSYLQKLTNIIKEIDPIYTNGWKIQNQAAIGNFHYQKMRMYYDFDENIDKLLNHPIINHMCDGELPVNVAHSIERDKLIDNLENIKDNFSILNYDSSQRWAILAARQGKNFILQGPPGTGKSQTITNIIGECLAVGKSVLFVSEKAVARDVILHNFEEIKYNNNPLADYCLTLNEQKSRKDGGRVKAMTKKEFKEQLNHHFSKRISSAKINTDYLTNFDGILEELMAYPACLHQVIDKYDQSLYQLISEWTRYRLGEDLPEIMINDEDKNEVFAINSIIGKYIAYKDIIDYDYRLHPYYGFIDITISHDRKYMFFKYLKQIIDVIKAWQDKEIIFNNLTNLHYPISNYNDFEKWLLTLLKPMTEMLPLSSELINNATELTTIKTLLTEQENYYINYFNKLSILLNNYDENVLTIPYKEIYTRYQLNYQNFLRIFKKQYKQDRFTLIYHRKDLSSKLTYIEMGKVLTLIKEINEQKAKIDINQVKLNTFLGPLYKDDKTDWLKIQQTIAQYEKLLLVVNESKRSFYQLFIDHYDEFHEKINNLYFIIKPIYQDYQDLNEKLQSFYDPNIISLQNNPFNDLLNYFTVQLNNPDKLDDWLEFLTLSKLPYSNEAFKVIDYLLDSNLPFNQMSISWMKKYYQTIINKTIEEKKEIIGSFSRKQYEQAINEFDQMDQSHLLSAPRRLYERLYQNKLTMCNDYLATSRSSNLITETDIKKSIRQIIKEKWEYIKYVKPCLMMSPLSVSQFIDSNVLFDVIIFDEASQVLPEDAIGAIVRGKQLIVSGDIQQLPPTNFFQKFLGKNSEDTDYEDESSEKVRSSILNSLAFLEPAIELKWHYRSLNEDLISFSNQHFYNNKLITFPSPNRSEEFGISFHEVPDGNYQGGGSSNRTNPHEVRDLMILLYDEIKNHPQNSIGIVAFNGNQSDLIRREWDKLKNEPSKKAVIDAWERDHLFDDILIANLETIQGEERDTMLLSVCYGPDPSGKIDLRSFGPIGQDGGEKRLNVSITRAKKKVIVIASMTGEQLKSTLLTNNNENKGITLLADYLIMARKGERDVMNITSDLALDMHMERDIYQVISKFGYLADFQVGVSDDKIDIAIKHPDHPDVYVAGIECDNLPYKRYNSVRDRELHRVRILTKGYNWKIYRIWALSWFKDNANEINALINFIQKAIDEYDESI